MLTSVMVPAVLWAGEGAEHTEGAVERHLPMPVYMFPIIAMAIFLLLLAITWAFRGTAAKLGGAAHGAHGGPAEHTEHVDQAERA